MLLDVPTLEISAFLDDFVQSLDNLPPEVAYHFTELSDLEQQIVKLREYQETAVTLALTSAATSAAASGEDEDEGEELGGGEQQEQQTYEEVLENYGKISNLQEQKIGLVKKCVDLVDKHRKTLDSEIQRFELFAPQVMTTTTETGEASASAGGSSTTSLAGIPPPQTPRPLAASLSGLSTTQKKKKLATRTPITGTATAATSVEFGTQPKRKRARRNISPATPPIKIVPEPRSHPVTLAPPVVEPAPTSTTTAAASSAAVATGTPTTTDQGVDEDQDNIIYCFCRQVSFGDMIACDSPDCPIEWFHYECVNLTTLPTGKWYCPRCAAKRRERKRLKSLA